MSIKKFIYLSLILITFAIIIKLSIISYLKETWNIDYNVVIYFSIINNLSVFLIGITTFKIIKKTNIKLIGYQIIFTICLFLSCFLLNIQKYSLKFIEFQNFIYIILISISFGILTIKLSQINFPKNFFINILSKIGKQSFSMYIIHCFVIKVIIVTADYYKIFFFKINLNTELILIILFLSSTMITYFLSKYTYEYIEKPGVNLGKKLTNAL
jgi:peptidoglycan/LPS O-acetylase OafA/YrhL